MIFLRESSRRTSPSQSNLDPNILLELPGVPDDALYYLDAMWGIRVKSIIAKQVYYASDRQ